MLKIKPYKELIQLEIENIRVPLEIHYDYRMSVRVSIAKSKAILRLPIMTTPITKEQNIQWAKNWIHKKLSGNTLLKQKFVPKDYNDGQQIEIRNKSFFLSIRFENNRKTATGGLTANKLNIVLPEDISAKQKQKVCSTILSRVFSNYFLPEIVQRVNELNHIHFRRAIGEIKMRHNHSNWGSCSSNNNISISSRLLLAPDFVMDYIIIHELAHVIEHNHSSRFWKLVETAMPDYMSAEQWLKEYGETCHW